MQLAFLSFYREKYGVIRSRYFQMHTFLCFSVIVTFASKYRELSELKRLSSLQTLQVTAKSPNNGSFQETKNKFIDFANTPLVKRRRSAHPLYDATFSFKQELTLLRSCGEGIFQFGFANLLLELKLMDKKVWCDAKVVEAVVSPWKNLSTPSDNGCDLFFDNKSF